LAALAAGALALAGTGAAYGQPKKGSPGPGAAPAADPTPEVERIVPRTGPTAGGTELAIFGQHFGGLCILSFTEPGCPNIIVYFGTEPAFVFGGFTSAILAISPRHVAGRVPVIVVTPSGSSASQGQDQESQFLYTGPAPAQTPGTLPEVSAVEPTHGPAGGFNRVVIRGKHLTPEDSLCVQCAGDVVHFGTTSVVVAQGSQSELVVTAPPHPRGSVDVTVTTNPGGTSMTSSADGYSFE
jgi:hypothetical protein